jgi:ubiquinone/menaquinone biosynthesis C-methylase UbiE
MGRPEDRVRDYYDGFDEWGRLDSASGRLELLRTLSLVKRFLRPPRRVLDLGGGPGRYTLALAECGFHVSLADLSPRLLDSARDRIRASAVADRVGSIKQVNATDLVEYRDSSFDAVLALGPFYHLTSASDRTLAAKEIVRVLKPEGLALVAFIPRFTGLKGLIFRGGSSPEQLSAEAFQEVCETGLFRNPSRSGFQEGWYPQTHELCQLFASTGLEHAAVVSVRGIAHDHGESLWRIRESDEPLFDAIMKAIETTEAEPSVIELGGHALYVGRKIPGSVGKAE